MEANNLRNYFQGHIKITLYDSIILPSFALGTSVLFMWVTRRYAGLPNYKHLLFLGGGGGGLSLSHNQPFEAFAACLCGHYRHFSHSLSLLITLLLRLVFSLSLQSGLEELSQDGL